MRVVVRYLIDKVTITVGRFKKNRRLGWSSATPLKLNLGCGLAVCQGWVNIDGSLNALIAGGPRFIHRMAYSLTGAKRYYSREEYCRLLGQHTFIHHDLSYSIPFEDQTANFVYSSHFLEHLSKLDAMVLLRESFRVLKAGGILRICVPDLRYAVSLYEEGRREEMLDNYFFVDDDGSHYARHKYMYDFQMLERALLEIGFTAVELRSFQAGLVPDIVKLDNRPEDTLFVEAKK